jgi:hypothetical protein
MDPGQKPKDARIEQSRRRVTTFTATQHPLTEKRAQALRDSTRVKLVLGRHVKETIHGYELGDIAWYEPSAYESQYENTLIYGPQGSGKTWVGESLAQQSFFAEKRTWFSVDTKGSFVGNWRPNLENADEIMECGLVPMGIPPSQIDIIEPEFFLKQITDKQIRESHVTQSYKIPLALCGLNLMFELTKLTKKASYASSFDVTFNELLAKTNNKPTIAEFEAMIENIKADPKLCPKQLVWVYDMMIGKIKLIAKFTIDEKNQWSAVGKSLFRAASEGKPRWIVFTLKHAKHANDDVNLAMVTAVLTEIKMFAEIARMNHLNIKLGVMVDELHTFVREKDSTTIEMIHDLMFAWGRTSKLWRIYMTQKQEQLPKAFQDSIEHLKLTGTFQNIISCQAVPTPGYGKLLDRLHARDELSPVDDTPRFYPHVKFMPPMCEVESPYSSNDDWVQHWREKFSGKKTTATKRAEKSWDEIALEMASAGQQPARVAVQRQQMPVNEAATVPEVNNMWNDIIRRLHDRNAA